ncbi:MAG: helix-turn-helix transcriptional regulator [Rhodanobacter sp.]
MNKTDPRQSEGELGQMLRHWRGLRGKSQIELSLDTGVSQRHLSFIESGRSTPGRQTLMNIAQGLDVPLRDRNRLLLAAGFAPIYSEDGWNAHEMHGITRALARVLRQHEPYPAVVMDRYWNVFMANESAPQFFNSFIDFGARPKPRNILHLMFDPAGMRPFIVNWPSASRGLIERIRREAVGHFMDEKTRDLLTALLAYPDVDRDVNITDGIGQEPVLPVIPLSFSKDGRVLNYFSMVSTVGTPQTIAAQELRVECMFPMDEMTEVYHHELMASAKGPGE